MADNEQQPSESHAIHVKSVAGILAIGMLFLVAGTTVAIFVVPIPDGNQTLVGQMIGTELALLGMAIAYFYGSSAANRKNQETIGNLVQTNLAAQTTLSAATPSGGAETMSLKPGELAVAVGNKGGGAEITKEPSVLDAVLDNLHKDTEKLDKTIPDDKA